MRLMPENPLQEKVFGEMLEDPQRFPALSLLYLANQKYSEKEKPTRRAFLKAIAALGAGGYVLFKREAEKAKPKKPLSRNAAALRLLASGASLSGTTRLVNEQNFKVFNTFSHSLEGMQKLPLFGNLPQEVRDKLLPPHDAFFLPFRRPVLKRWREQPGAIARETMVSAASLTAAYHALAFLAGVPRSALDLSLIHSGLKLSEAMAIGVHGARLSEGFEPGKLRDELNALHGIVARHQREQRGKK